MIENDEKTLGQNSIGRKLISRRASVQIRNSIIAPKFATTPTQDVTRTSRLAAVQIRHEVISSEISSKLIPKITTQDSVEELNMCNHILGKLFESNVLVDEHDSFNQFRCIEK